MAASITREVGMSNRCRGDVVNQSVIDLTGASVAVIWMPSKLTERASEAANC
jgi:hypothetical protein